MTHRASILLVGSLLAFAVGAGAGAHAEDPALGRTLTLVGVVLGNPDGPVAAIKNERTSEERFYRVGDVVERATVVEIRPDRIVLSGGGGTVELRLAASRGSVGGRPVPIPGPGVGTTGRGYRPRQWPVR